MTEPNQEEIHKLELEKLSGALKAVKSNAEELELLCRESLSVLDNEELRILANMIDDSIAKFDVEDHQPPIRVTQPFF